MGSSWSFSTSSPSSSSTNKTSNNVSSSRKRQRVEDEDETATDTVDEGQSRSVENSGSGDGRSTTDGNMDEEQPPSRKRRRLLLSLPSPTVWAVYAMDRLCCFLARGFLLAIEVAVQKRESASTTGGGDGESSSSLSSSSSSSSDDHDRELIEYLFLILDYFQSGDDEILRRGWRAVHAFSCHDSNNDNDGMAEKQKSQEELNETIPPGTNSIISEVSTVVSVMKRYPESTRVQMLGCRALRTLTNRDDNWKALWEAGAINVFLQSLTDHPDHLVVQGLAVTFLATLIREEGDEPRRQVLEGGGVELILRAMERFEHDPHLVHTGCYAMHQLGFTRPSKVLLVQHGGIPLLLRSVELHMDKVWLVDLCLNALTKLCDEDAIQGLNIIPLVLKSMEAYPKKRSLNGHCLVLFLRAEVGRDLINDRIMESTVRVILAAMRSFPECSSIQFFGCAALREILTQTRSRPDREAFNLMVAGGGIECVLNALEKHGEIYGLQPMAILFLLTIWELRSPDAQAAYSAFGGSDNTIALVAAGFMDNLENVAGDGD